MATEESLVRGLLRRVITIRHFGHDGEGVMKNRMRVPKGLTPRQFDFEMLDMMGATDEQLAAFMPTAEIKEYHAYIEGKEKPDQG